MNIRLLMGLGLAIAVGTFTPTIARANPQLDALTKLGNEQIQNRNFAEAVQSYNDAIQLDGNNARLYSGLGYAYAQMGNYRDAAIAYQQAVQLDNKNAEFYNALGFSLAHSGDNQSAMIAYSNAVQLKPDNLDYNLGLATVLFRMGGYEQALSTYQKILKMDSKNENAIKNTLTCLLQLGRNREAAAMLPNAFQSLPTDPELRIHAAITWFGLRDKTKAISYLEEALKLGSQDADLQVKVGKIYENQNLLPEAIAAFQRATEIEPGSIPALANLGAASLKAQDGITAIIAYRQLSEISPGDPAVFYNLALALESRSRSSEAMTALETAKKLYLVKGNQQGVKTVEALIAAIADK